MQVFLLRKGISSHQYNHHRRLLWQACTTVSQRTSKHELTLCDLSPSLSLHVLYLSATSCSVSLKTGRASKQQLHVAKGVFFHCLMDELHQRRGLCEEESAVAEIGSAASQCSCLCEVRCERALIMNGAESETCRAYIIEEHIVKEEVALKHQITSALTSHSLRKVSADSEQNKRGRACSYITTQHQ